MIFIFDRLPIRPAWFPHRLHTRTKVLLAGLLMLHIITTMVVWHRSWPVGFDARSYLAAAQAVVDEQPLVQLARPDLLGWNAPTDTPPYLYPPLLALLLTPLTLIPPPVALATWLGLVLLATLLLIPLLRRFVGWRTAALAVLLFLPTWKSVGMGQINAMIAIFYSCALLAVQRQQLARSGAWLALGVLFKLVPAIGLLVLAARRAWGSVLIAGGIGAAVVALTLPWVNITAWRDGILAANTVQWYTIGMMSWTGQASYWLGDLGTILGYGITATLLLITLMRAPKLPPVLALSAAIIVPLLVARVTWDHHALMALPALAVLYQHSSRGRRLAGSTWLLLSFTSGILSTMMLTLCWAACCWPPLLQDESARTHVPNDLPTHNAPSQPVL